MEFEKIYRQHFDDVYRYLRGLTLNESVAEELTQETFFRAFKGKAEFRGECSLKTWLCQIAKNLYFDYLKKSKRFEDDVDISKVEDEKTSVLDMLIDKELALQIHKELHMMKEPYKEVFTLRIFGELSFKEIGSVFGKSEHWACVTFHRAKEKIKNKMEEYNEN